jgi:hypothetical protein
MLALGLATPLAAASLASVMLTALRTVVWRERDQDRRGRLRAASARHRSRAGAGPWSLDAFLKSERRGSGWAAAALAVAATGSTLAIELGKRQPVPAPDREAAKSAAT